jgi:hypothetical protein
MLENLTLTEERMILCEHSTITEGEERIKYYFYFIITSSGNEYYAIEVENKDSSELAVVGDEFELAKAVYSRVVDGRVSALTLEDIIHDVKMSKNY